MREQTKSALRLLLSNVMISSVAFLVGYLSGGFGDHLILNSICVISLLVFVLGILLLHRTIRRRRQLNDQFWQNCDESVSAPRWALQELSDELWKAQAGQQVTIESRMQRLACNDLLQALKENPRRYTDKDGNLLRHEK